jgi:Cys-tRNA(Pro) deacylase
MAADRVSVTPAIRTLRAAGVQFSEHLYSYEERGGTRVSARELGLDEHSIVKTLVMEDDHREPLLVLMHGDMSVSTRNLARSSGARSIAPCDPAAALRHTGFQVGGTSPFGTRRGMPVYVQRTIFHLPRIYINGGRRGFLIGIEPHVITRLLAPTVVDVALPRD